MNGLKICQSLIDKANKKAESSPLGISPPEPVYEPSTQTELTSLREELDAQTDQDTSDQADACKRILTSIVRRQGQTQFRQALLTAYGRKCAITGFDAEAALEAAHIIPYAETSNNDTTNGILLRADLHTLFDLHLLAIHPDTLQVSLHPDLHSTEYRAFHGQQVRIPEIKSLQPAKKYLEERRQQCNWL